MKKSFIIATLLFTSFNAMAEKIIIGVDGMVCSFCAQGITKKFKAEKAVSSVDVKLEDHKVTLETKSALSDDQIKSIIKDAGYSISSIVRE